MPKNLASRFRVRGIRCIETPSEGGGSSAPPADQPATPPAPPASPVLPAPVVAEPVGDPKPPLQVQYEAARASALNELQAQVNTLTASLAAKELTETRVSVAKELGLPEGVAARLTGETRDEMLTDGKALVELLKPADPFRAVTDNREGNVAGKQYTREDLKTMTPAQINEARVKGQLKNLGF